MKLEIEEHSLLGMALLIEEPSQETKDFILASLRSMAKNIWK